AAAMKLLRAGSPASMCLPRLLALFSFLEPIADPAHGLYQTWVAELSPQGLDMHVDGPLEDDGTFGDGRVHELMASESPTRLAEKIFQEPEFRRSEFHFLAAG